MEKINCSSFWGWAGRRAFKKHSWIAIHVTIDAISCTKRGEEKITDSDGTVCAQDCNSELRSRLLSTLSAQRMPSGPGTLHPAEIMTGWNTDHSFALSGSPPSSVSQRQDEECLRDN